MKHSIRLTKGDWTYDDDKMLGKAGGFGAVFQGESSEGRHVAIKRLRADAVGPVEREVELAQYFLGHEHPHVIGIFDVGRDNTTGEIFIVMECAQQSLQELVDSEAPLAPAAALEILDAIAAGLEKIGEIAHRDLKPANVLLHQGVWKIADLGLARFLEATTAPVSMRDFLSFQYCAPEQLNAERPTKATDVYALGGIAYALLTGAPPFPGPTHIDYADQHRFRTPPSLNCTPALAQLAIDCLSKTPTNRPSLSSIRSRIQKARESLGVSVGPSPVAEAAKLLAEKRAAVEVARLRIQKTINDRNQSAREAIDRLNSIRSRLLQSIARACHALWRKMELSMRVRKASQ